MKIAFVVSAFPVVSETFIVNQICSLIDAGHDVRIFTFKRNKGAVIHESVRTYGVMDKLITWIPEPKSKWKRFVFFCGVIFGRKLPYHPAKVASTLNFFKHGKKALSLHYFYKCQWFLQKNAFDVIHCHFAPSGLFVARLRRAGFLNSEKIVTSFHGTDINPGKVEEYKTKYKVLFDEMDLLTYNSEYTLEIIKRVNASSNKLRLLPVGLDTTHFSKKKESLQQGTTQLVYCGRMVPFKGPDIAIEILNELVKRNNDVHLTMIGTGEMMGSIRQQIELLGLQHKTTLTGAISQEEIIEIMDTSHIFLLPGIHDAQTGRAENQGLVIQEAQSMQLPVVVSTAGGMKYGLIDKETGFVVPEKNVEQFVETLELLIQDPDLRAEMGKKGRAFVRENFDSKILGDRLLSYYNEF